MLHVVVRQNSQSNVKWKLMWMKVKYEVCFSQTNVFPTTLFDALLFRYAGKEMSAKKKAFFSQHSFPLPHSLFFPPLFLVFSYSWSPLPHPPHSNTHSAPLWIFIYKRKSGWNILNTSAWVSYSNCQGETGGLLSAVSPCVCLDQLQGCIFMNWTNLRLSSDEALVLVCLLH